MPREWPSVARLVAWRKPCAPADASRLRTDVADAFVDRTPIAWGSLLARAQSSRDRDLFEHLCQLDRLRDDNGRLAAGVDASPPAFFVVRAALALAAVQIACSFGALALACVRGQAAIYRTPQIVLAIAFAVASLLLGAASSRDRRSLFALAVFATVASAFARAPLAGLSNSSSMWFAGIFRGLFPEAFAPAALWQFAVVFPAVQRFTWFDLAARRVSALVSLLGGAVFSVNVAIAYHALNRGALRAFERDDPGNAFWHLFTLMFLPAVATILVRSRRAPAAERRKVLRFATSIAVGTGPFLVCGVLRLSLPRVNDWFLFATSPARVGTDRLIIGALAAMPLLATMALIADRPFARQTAMLRSLGDRIARLLSVARGIAHADGHQRRLASALEQLRLARGQREIAAVLSQELTGGTGSSTARVLISNRGGDGRTVAFVDPFCGATPLSSESGLIAICGNTSSPLDLSPDSPLMTLIPESDRDWVTRNDVAMMAPLRERGGGIAAMVALGPGRGGRALGRRDRWFIRALVAGAAAAWAALESQEPGDAGTVYAGGDATAGEAAFECPGCGLVMKSNPGSCRCGRQPTLAALPWRVGSKFVVVRRIGAGGMGVVYVARDTTLDRDVALKTLPGLRDDAAAGLRAEARAMAALNHESLATIYGLEFWRHTPILVVEYFPEGTLAARLARGRLSPEEALAIGVRLAQALSYMHARGVLHRDLKPSNIGFTASGVPKLLDFGLATLMRSSADSELLSDSGALLPPLAGTSAYLPPEALLGAPSPSFDLWALSIIILESLIGRQQARKTMAGRTVERAVRCDFADVPATPERRRHLAAFFERALALQPARRFATGRELQSALESVADACPTC